MRLATWNVHKCIGSDGVFDPRRTARVLLGFRADVVALQEADERFGARRGLLGREWLEKRGLRIVEAPSTTEQSHGWRGNVLAVAQSMEVETVAAVSLPGIEPRGALVADLRHLPSGTRIRVVACHLGLLRRCRSKQAETLAACLRSPHHRAVALMGDTNEWRDDTAARSSLRRLHGMGLRGDRHATFPARFPLLGLDRIMSNLPGRARTDGTVEDASDHLPLLMDVEMSG